jgi:hypothetical protein
MPYPAVLNELLDLLMATSIQGKDLRRKFHDDPEKVADKLTKEARGALYSMNRLLITTECAKEYQASLPLEKFTRDFPPWQLAFYAWKMAATEFPKSELDADCANAQLEYPDPTPVVATVKPNSIAAGSGAVSIEIVGQGFVKGKTKMEITDPSGALMTLNPDPPNLKGSFRCGHLTTSITAPTTKGICNVRVFVDVGGGARIEVPPKAGTTDITIT